MGDLFDIFRLVIAPLDQEVRVLFGEDLTAIGSWSLDSQSRLHCYAYFAQGHAISMDDSDL